MTALALAVTTPPRSGPWCRNDCVGYPYTDAAEFVPRDYLWMYPATALALLALALTVVVAGYPLFTDPGAGPGRPAVLGPLAVALAAVAGTALVADYGIQLAVVQPSLQRGEAAGLSLFSQYNPHGIFIALEDVGYLVLSLAFLAVGSLLAGSSRSSRLLAATRWVFLTGGLGTPTVLLGLSLRYGLDLEYRFEVAAILIDWTVLVVGAVLLGVGFASPASAGSGPEPAQRCGPPLPRPRENRPRPG